jgi:23S rRNA (cytidine1920-2'-O)/16S rRNA (cytidine1409-2'-O)-methyltransferase
VLVERGLVDTRTRAQALIAAGKVYSDEVRLDKPGHMVAQDAPLSVRGAEHPWVSRGGMKLKAALDHFGLKPAGKICLDIGASTGGFTDVLLASGAAKVYAVDVGHGQLDWKLRQEAKVVVLEKTNARHLAASLVPDPIDLIVCDASFISLKTVLPAGLALAKTAAHLVALIKPQFEVGKGRVGKGGIVRDPALHREVCDRITRWLADTMRWRVFGLTDSPITGADGNIEFLIAAERP